MAEEKKNVISMVFVGVAKHGDELKACYAQVHEGEDKELIRSVHAEGMKYGAYQRDLVPINEFNLKARMNSGGISAEVIAELDKGASVLREHKARVQKKELVT